MISCKKWLSKRIYRTESGYFLPPLPPLEKDKGQPPSLTTLFRHPLVSHANWKILDSWLTWSLNVISKALAQKFIKRLYYELIHLHYSKPDISKFRRSKKQWTMKSNKNHGEVNGNSKVLQVLLRQSKP